jgi:hypothetical protein
VELDLRKQKQTVEVGVVARLPLDHMSIQPSMLRVDQLNMEHVSVQSQVEDKVSLLHQRIESIPHDVMLDNRIDFDKSMIADLSRSIYTESKESERKSER